MKYNQLKNTLRGGGGTQLQKHEILCATHDNKYTVLADDGLVDEIQRGEMLGVDQVLCFNNGKYAIIDRNRHVIFNKFNDAEMSLAELVNYKQIAEKYRNASVYLCGSTKLRTYYQKKLITDSDSPDDIQRYKDKILIEQNKIDEQWKIIQETYEELKKYNKPIDDIPKKPETLQDAENFQNSLQNFYKKIVNEIELLKAK